VVEAVQLSSCGGAPLTYKHHRNLARHCWCVYVLQDPALSFLESMAARYGIKPEARHVTYVVSGLAKATNFDDASSLIDAAGNRGWGRNAGEPGQHGWKFGVPWLGAEAGWNLGRGSTLSHPVACWVKARCIRLL
jgi:hypothetical protein